MSKEDWMAVGDLLRASRDGQDMSQKALATAAGVSERTVQAYESGMHRTGRSRVLPRLEAALGLPKGALRAALNGGTTPTTITLKNRSTA